MLSLRFGQLFQLLLQLLHCLLCIAAPICQISNLTLQFARSASCETSPLKERDLLLVILLECYCSKFLLCEKVKVSRPVLLREIATWHLM